VLRGFRRMFRAFRSHFSVSDLKNFW